MKKKTNLKEKEENRLLTYYIFKGMSYTEIAKKLNFSRSCVGYKINKLFAKFNVNNRLDFVICTLAKIIENKKTLLEIKQEKIIKLQKENKELKKLLKN